VVALLLSHARETKPEGHVPENNSNVGVAFPNLPLPLVMLLKVIVADGPTATNLYHTSSSAAPPQAAFAAIPELVAFVTVPAVAPPQVVVDEVRSTAPEQSSLPGCAKFVFENKIKIKNNTAVRAVDGRMVLKGFGRKQ
jgi:hypothetical protein